MTTQRTGPVFTGVAAAMGSMSLVDVSQVALDLSGLSSETVSVTASVNGGANYNTAKLRPISFATGTQPASSDLGNGLYRIDVTGLSNIKFTKSNTSETVTLRTGLGFN